MRISEPHAWGCILNGSGNQSKVELRENGEEFWNPGSLGSRLVGLDLLPDGYFAVQNDQSD